jgi:hypothetical protein
MICLCNYKVYKWLLEVVVTIRTVGIWGVYLVHFIIIFIVVSVLIILPI